MQKEILLTPTRSPKASVIEARKNARSLPECVCAKLSLEEGALLAMVRRKDAVALKRAAPDVVEAARASLWELVVKQNGRAGRGPGWDRYYCGYAGLLQVFAAFDHLAATIGIMRWLPWIVESQNSDGSWGDEGHRRAVPS